MATKTPIPPGPPPRGFRWPDQPPTGAVGPIGTGPTADRTVVVQPGRHGITVFVGVMALVVGLLFGFQLGKGSDDTNSSAPATVDPNTTDAPTVTTTPPTTSPDTTPTTDGEDGEDGVSSPEPLGTLQNPIPIGQNWILGIWQLKVHSADLDAVDTVVAESSENPKPRDGSTYVLADIELTLVDDLFVFVDDFQPGIARADGTEIPFEFRPCGPSVPDDFYGHGRLSAQDPVRGNLCFQVPTDATDGLLLTTPGIGDAPTYFALTE